MNGQPYDPNQPQGSQQQGGFQSPYGSYQQQNGYTGYQQPVNQGFGQQGAGYQQPYQAYSEQSSYAMPDSQQNAGYQQPVNQLGSGFVMPGYDAAYPQPVDQGNAAYGMAENEHYGQQAPYQQNGAYTGYQQSYQQPYQQVSYQQSYQQPYVNYPQPQESAYQTFPSQGMQNNYPYQVGGVPHSTQQQPMPQQKDPIDVEAIIRLVVRLMVPVLGVLFILSMVFSGAVWLKWIFVGLSLAEVAVIWVRPMLLQNDLKITFSCIFLVLALVAAISAIVTPRSDAVIPPTGSTGSYNQGSTPLNNGGTDAVPGLTENNNVLQLTATPAPTATPEPAGNGLEGEAVQRLMSFLYFWQVNDTESMIGLCSPSWVRAQQKPMESLFQIQANRQPTEFTATAISGTENDVSRTVNVTIMMTRYDNKTTEKYAFKVVMQKENDMWYVDPQSLQSNEKVVTQAPSAEITQLPTPAPVADSSAVLYYNPNGGTRYHIDANCKSTNSKYLPFSGTFTYGQLTNAPYNELSPCSVCGAPLRPAN